MDGEVGSRFARNGTDVIDVVYRPRTISPIPEEMEFEESLARRFAAHPPGPGYLATPLHHPRASLDHRCQRCGEPKRWGSQPCGSCAAAEAAASAGASAEAKVFRSSRGATAARGAKGAKGNHADDGSPHLGGSSGWDLVVAVALLFAVATIAWRGGIRELRPVTRDQISCPSGAGAANDC